MACPLDEPPPAAHGYGPDVISLFLRLVLGAGVALRAVPRVLQTLNQALGLSLPVPCWTAGRLWLLRLGHAMLTAPQSAAQDWVWLIDHSVQIGQDKCLVILGIRAADLPEPGQGLRHEDLELIALLPATNWTRADVDQALETSVQRTGSVPRAIVNDHGVDITGGVALFQQRHPQTIEIYDAKHKAACLLKARLGRNPRWQEFQTRVGQTRCSVQQTELAFLTPPGPKPKARFMNLQRQLAWARRVLANLREPAAVKKFATVRRLREKFGWVAAFQTDVTEWSQWQQVVDATVLLINNHGIYRGVAEVLASRLSQLDALVSSARDLGEELVQFVRLQESQVRPGERLPGSTEVLESCFGKFKQLEKQHSRGGFTQLLLGFGAMLADVTTDVVRSAMQASKTLDVRRWAADTLGVTLFAQRKIAFASATESG
jgi:hypothetical protein